MKTTIKFLSIALLAVTFLSSQAFARGRSGKTSDKEIRQAYQKGKNQAERGNVTNAAVQYFKEHHKTDINYTTLKNAFGISAASKLLSSKLTNDLNNLKTGLKNNTEAYNLAINGVKNILTKTEGKKLEAEPKEVLILLTSTFSKMHDVATGPRELGRFKKFAEEFNNTYNGKNVMASFNAAVKAINEKSPDFLEKLREMCK